MDSYTITPTEPRKPLSRDPDELLRQTTTMLFYKHELPGTLREKCISDFYGLYKQRNSLDARLLLRKMFIVLDYYYFQRSLSEHGVQLCIYNRGPTGCDDLVGIYGHRKIYIYKHASKNGERVSPSEMISTLIHEMTHAYFDVLTDRAKYQADNGHGLPWNALYHSIINDVCKFSDELVTFGQLFDKKGASEDIDHADRLSYPLDGDEDEDEDEQVTADEGQGE